MFDFNKYKLKHMHYFQIKQQQKLEKQQLKMAKQETAPKIKVKVRKPANPKKLVLNSPDFEESLGFEGAATVKTENEDESERHVSNDFLARMKANLEQQASASGGQQVSIFSIISLARATMTKS